MVHRLIQRTSVVTLSVAGILKEILTVLIASAVFDDRLTPVNITGLCIAIGGIGAYNWIKYRSLNDTSSEAPEGGYQRAPMMEEHDDRDDHDEDDEDDAERGRKVSQRPKGRTGRQGEHVADDDATVVFSVGADDSLDDSLDDDDDDALKRAPRSAAKDAAPLGATRLSSNTDGSSTPTLTTAAAKPRRPGSHSGTGMEDAVREDRYARGGL